MKQMNDNIEEQRVGYDNAKLLKEKSFGVKCTHFYILNFGGFKADLILNQFNTPIEDNKNILQLCNTTKQPHLALAPTQQVAIDWLLKNHNIWIHVAPENHEYNIVIWKLTIQMIDNEVRFVRTFGQYNTPEEAKEAAINHVLTKMI